MSFRYRHVLFSLSAAVLLTGCASSLPMHVERSGTLPAASYAQFDQAAAKLPTVELSGPAGSFPEPKWAYAFNAPFDPHAAPLQIGTFTGRGDTANHVAGNLPGQLVRVLGEANLFPQVTLQPIAHAYVLAGTVTRAEDQDGLESGAATQVEATVSRDGVMLGAIQINSMQIGMMPLSPFMLLTTAIMSAGQGTRASFVSERVAEVFRSAATGTLCVAWAGGMSHRYLRTPEAKD